MFFSIIVPIYNAENSLEKCLGAILAQTFEDYEVILVDDGSLDNSFAICEHYAGRDYRFTAIHQDNRGPSAARNTGLERASGDYVCFVDSDDYIAADYLAQLYRKLKETQAEVLFFGYNKVNRYGHILEKHVSSTTASGVALLKELSEKDLFGYTWIKVCSRILIGDSCFPKDISLFEDEIFTCSILERTKKIAVLPKAIYCYAVDGENMLTGRTYADFCELSDRVFSAWERLMQDAPGRDPFLEKKANSFVTRCRYYGFERDINIRAFFKSLADTRFFQYHTKWTLLDRLIRLHFWPGVRMAAYCYKIKNRVAAYRHSRVNDR